jgi:phospholipid/cholesterol/gamma-HCH transport system substrate-binding protein
MQVKLAIANAQQTTANLNQASLHVDQVITDLQQRNLGQKAEDTLNNAKDATQQLDQSSRQVNSSLDEALGPDRNGRDAGANLRDTISNANIATANIADDTEALKHEFFFRGFFKKRGYYSLSDLTPDQYRVNRYFDSPGNLRAWLGVDAFSKDPSGDEVLSEVGKMQIDQNIGKHQGSVMNRSIVIEGYSNSNSASDEMLMSRKRAILIARYVERRYHLRASNVGVMPLEATPPGNAGKSTWDGACIVFAALAK